MTDETATRDEMAETTADEGSGSEETSQEATADTGRSRRQRSRERVSERDARVADERRRQAEEAFEDFRHLRDCPEEGRKPGDEDSRVEYYPATRPRDEDHPEKRMLVLRCIECGEAEVLADESEE